MSPNDNQFMGTCDKNARPTTVQLGALDKECHARGMYNLTAVRLADNDTNEKKVLYLTATQDMAQTRQRSKPNRKTQRSQLHFACGLWKPSNARTTSPRPCQIHLANTQTKKLHRHTLHVCKCASFQRNLKVENNLSAIHVASVAVETQCQRPQLRMDGQQFWSTPTVPPTTRSPRQDATRCTGESRSVREDFHTLPQPV